MEVDGLLVRDEDGNDRLTLRAGPERLADDGAELIFGACVELLRVPGRRAGSKQVADGDGAGGSVNLAEGIGAERHHEADGGLTGVRSVEVVDLLRSEDGLIDDAADLGVTGFAGERDFDHGDASGDELVFVRSVVEDDDVTTFERGGAA